MKIIFFSFLLVTSIDGMRVARVGKPNAPSATRSMRMVPKRISVSAPPPTSLQIQLKEINERIRDTSKKERAAWIKSKAWNTTGAVVISPLALSTIAIAGLSGAAGFVGLVFAPDWILEGNVLCLAIHTVGANAVFLASRKALYAEERLAGFLSKKCNENDQEIIETKNIIEALQKRRAKILAQNKILEVNL